MGTKAKNPRVNVKPFNTTGGFTSSILQAIFQLVIGSVHVDGWVTSCQMGDGKNFNFTGHTEVRYWSQILNAYYFHDQYTSQDGISNAPQNMVCYAHWRDAAGFGSAGTYMLNNLTGSQISSAVLQWIFGNAVGGQLSSLMHGLLPDMSISVCGITEPVNYSSQLAETVFHELAHASQYRQVGPIWYTELGFTEIFHTGTINPYGDDVNFSGGGKVQLAESWAEFLGMNYVNREYATNALLKATNTIGTGFSSTQYYRADNLIENQFWFYGGQWIPMGIYHDLMDNTNVAPNNANEVWDRVQGVSIYQLYSAFGSDVNNICDYKTKLLQQNSSLNVTDVNDIFTHHNAICN